jgi:hypothetical protein
MSTATREATPTAEAYVAAAVMSAQRSGYAVVAVVVPGAEQR